MAGQPYFLAVEGCWLVFAGFECFDGWKAMSGKMNLFMKIGLQGFGFQLTKLGVTSSTKHGCPLDHEEACCWSLEEASKASQD